MLFMAKSCNFMSKTSVSNKVHYKVLGGGQNKLRKTLSAFVCFNIITY